MSGVSELPLIQRAWKAERSTAVLSESFYESSGKRDAPELVVVLQ